MHVSDYRYCLSKLPGKNSRQILNLAVPFAQKVIPYQEVIRTINLTNTPHEIRGSDLKSGIPACLGINMLRTFSRDRNGASVSGRNKPNSMIGSGYLRSIPNLAP